MFQLDKKKLGKTPLNHNSTQPNALVGLDTKMTLLAQKLNVSIILAVTDPILMKL